MVRNFTQIFERLRPRLGRADRVKLGPGVVGNTSAAMMVAIPALAAIVWALGAHPIYALVALAGGIALCVYFLRGTWRFAEKQPDLALLGGAELLQLRQLQAAKDVADIPLMPAEEPPAFADALPIEAEQHGK